VNVYPRQTLEAERDAYDSVRSVFAIDPDDDGRYLLGGFTTEVFDLLFVPAERLDALIEAARAIERAHSDNIGHACNQHDLCVAVRAYDEGQEQ